MTTTRRIAWFVALAGALAAGVGLQLAAQTPAPASAAAAAVATAASTTTTATTTTAPASPASAPAQPEVCFESRKGATEVARKDLKPGLPNVKCSPTTGAALWYGDPYDGTVPMGKMPLLDKIAEGQAVVKPRTEKLTFYAQCGTACHNGTYPKGFPTSNKPVPIPTMEAMVPDLKNFQHGRGRIWCLECHHTTKRNMLVDHYGEPISMDQPQLLCGKCHGDKLRDWRDGIHGKRIGQFTTGGKQRWFTCTECHNPHNVQDGARERGFIQLQPETPPQLPKGMKSAAHERTHPIAH